MRVALGLKARTGRAIIVALGGEPLRVVERAQIPLLPKGDFAPYHVAEALPADRREASVQQSIGHARRLAEQGIRQTVARMASAGHDVRACGVLVGRGMPGWTTDEIVAVHVRMHQAEGELFRDVLVSGARANGFEPVTIREKYAMEDAASKLALSQAQVESAISTLGKAAGPPWGKDQKEAALAALAALHIAT